jgi:hypothetical protein
MLGAFSPFMVLCVRLIELYMGSISFLMYAFVLTMVGENGACCIKTSSGIYIIVGLSISH